ncbi:dihydroorotase [Protomyces lactucae-debilis]|uniref:dihydroorotase n=1 Tax=Protomyces lactucae-debilis TaxID=2754530 RepID=A0A1Y2FWS4_PROLT|nr:dihydroorotase [Protomyces lactucae-debilis]ORY87754.1 dihydroorotase [Protomyces lactucae-debilis]
MLTMELPAIADYHVHLRHGDLMKAVVPTIRQGGVNVVYVMPNLVPPITSVEQCLSYKAELESIDSQVTYLMTLYLSPPITAEVIRAAAKAGISGVKSYPKGATTNSQSGIESYEPFYPTFAAMEECGLVLNLHGEVPPASAGGDVTVMTAEHAFLPTLLDLHKRFPRLRIVLEHCTTADAIQAVLACGPTVAGTITAHHLFLTVDQWVDNPFSYCKPVAKLPSDREALLKAATSGNPKFFLGTDSAPHLRAAKSGGKRTAAGVFTQPYVLPYVATAFEKLDELSKLENFACKFGRSFYGHESVGVNEKILLVRQPTVIAPEIGGVVPFMAEEELAWSVQWK